jgi:hydrogenase-4 component B
MQYTGSSFSWDFSTRFRSLMVLLYRHKAPEGYFPQDAYVITDCVDAVERRLYAVIGRGDSSASEVSRRLREDDPRLAFAAGLVALVLIAGLVVLAGGPLR